MGRHIVVVSDYGYINGGNAKIAIYTAIGLADSGEDVTFFCGTKTICDELKESQCHLLVLNQEDIHQKNTLLAIKENLNNKVAYKAFKKLIDSFGDDEVIVHIHSWCKAISSSPFRYLKSKGNVKVVLTLHDYFFVCPNGGLYNYKKGKICKIGNDFKCFFTNCDKHNYCQKIFRFIRYKKQQIDMEAVKNFIYISSTNKNAFESRYKKEGNFYYVQNFVELGQEMHIDFDKNSLYLYIGRISEEKGIDLFCKALAVAGKRGIIIGDGPLAKKIKKKYPLNEYPGWLSKEGMIPFIKRSKALVFPSKWYEASPLTPIEMASYGLPIICSYVCAASNFVSETKCGVVYHDYNELLSILKDDNLRLKCQKTLGDFSLKRYIENIKNVYKQL